MQCVIRLVGAFMNPVGFQRRSLADMILDKIKEKEEAADEEAGAEEGASDDNDDDAGMRQSQLPPKVCG